MLLVLGGSFFAGGLKFKESNFKVTAAQTSSSLMTLAGITLVIPAAYHSSQVGKTSENALTNLMRLADDPSGPPNPNDGTTPGLLIISRGTAVALFFVYLTYLYFQLVSHADLFQADPARRDASDGVDEEEEEQASMSLIAATVSLLGVTVVTSFCADYLVASIEETAERYHIPKPFIGVILIPIVANAAEHFTAIWMAMKDKMELSIGIAVGSSIQIATFVIPLLVIVGWITGHELTLYFADFETIVLFVTVLLADLLINDGKSNYLEGLMLITLYLVIGLAFWVS
jgi:Ca2+:H+ antiporter